MVAQIPLSLLLPLFCLVLLRRLLLALQFKTACACFGLQLHAAEWFGLPAASIMYNYFLPAHAGASSIHSN